MKNFTIINQKKLLIFGIIVITVIFIWAVIYFTKVNAPSQMQFFEVKKGMIKTELSQDIILASAMEVQLAFENPGKIRNVFVSAGDRVKKGQLLAEEENSDYLASLRGAIAKRDAASAQLKQAKEDVDIQKAKLRSLKSADAKKYDIKAQEETKEKSQAGVEVQIALLAAARSAVDEVNLKIAKTRLIAPIDGVITEKSIESGEVVGQAEPVIKIASENNFEAIAFVSELDVKKLSIGNEADIEISSTEKNIPIIKARIKSIYPTETVQNSVSSYKVVFEFANQNNNLKSGMTGTAKIRLSEQVDVVYIPQDSIFSDGGKKYVIVMSGSGFPEKKEVQVGAYDSDGMAEIISGLTEGDRIIRF